MWILTFAVFVLVILFWLCVDEIIERANLSSTSSPGKANVSILKLLLPLGLLIFAAVNVFAGMLYISSLLGSK